MSLRTDELHRFSQAVLALNAAPTLAQFSLHLLHAVRCVVAGDIAVVDWSGVAQMRGHTFYDPFGAISPQINQAVHRHLPEHPRYLRRRGQACSISDVLPRRVWHCSALYGEAYGRMGQEDGLGLDIALSQGSVLTLNMTRSRRGFGDGERCALALLEPHVRSQWQRLRAQEQLRSELLLPPALDRLTAREREVLLWLAGGKPNAEIAGLLGIRPGTVKRHLENLYAKLGVGNRTDAARLFQRLEPRSG